MKTHFHAENENPEPAGRGSTLPYGAGSSGAGAARWDDAGLIAALQARDADAVTYAVETYAPKLYRFAVYQLGDTAAAEDLVSEVITRMLEKIDDLRYTGAPFQAWLFSIARNLVADSYRRKNRAQVFSLDRPLSSDSESQGADLISSEVNDFDSYVETFANREVLVRILGNLTADQRQIVVLRVIEGWQPTEIARLLGKSVDSVKSLQYRALQSLRRFWERDVYTEPASSPHKDTGSASEEGKY